MSKKLNKAGETKSPDKKSKRALIKSHKITLFASLSASVLVIVVVGLGLYFLTKDTARYDTLDEVQAAFQKGIPTTCEFNLVNGENGYEDNDMFVVVSIDGDKNLLREENKYSYGDLSFNVFTLYRDGYIFKWSYDNDNDPYVYENKSEIDVNEIISSNIKDFMEDSSYTRIFTQASSYTCRAATDKDFELPSDKEIYEVEYNQEFDR